MDAIAVIPARLDSNRFPNKIMEYFLGKPIIDNVIENTKKLNFIKTIVVTTDSKVVRDHVKNNFPEVDVYYDLTPASCGTERVYNYYLRNKSYSWYISIPCDEVYIDPDEFNNYVKQNIYKISRSLISTFYTRFYNYNDLQSNLSCKIISSSDNYMIYNTRTVLPVTKDGKQLPLNEYKKHVGLFIFPNSVFKNCGTELWKESSIQSLEQNRFLKSGYVIKLIEINHIGFGIDQQWQIEHLEKRIIDNGKI